MQAFPNLRLFKDSTAQNPDYRNDRTLDAMMSFIKQKLATDEQVASMHPAAQGNTCPALPCPTSQASITIPVLEGG